MRCFETFLRDFLWMTRHSARCKSGGEPRRDPDSQAAAHLVGAYVFSNADGPPHPHSALYDSDLPARLQHDETSMGEIFDTRTAQSLLQICSANRPGS
jgi:hypothetical protein